jgi:anti-sigma B factor antagonist
LVDAPRESPLRQIVIDFGQMTYFGSGMLEAILLLWNHIHPSGGKLRLCNVSPVGREILDVSNFSTLWPICENRQAALEALRA